MARLPCLTGLVSLALPTRPVAAVVDAHLRQQAFLPSLPLLDHEVSMSLA
jgi:hypothetical protein